MNIGSKSQINHRAAYFSKIQQSQLADGDKGTNDTITKVMVASGDHECLYRIPFSSRGISVGTIWWTYWQSINSILKQDRQPHGGIREITKIIQSSCILWGPWLFSLKSPIKSILVKLWTKRSWRAEADAAMPLAWLETTYDRCSSTETIDQLVNQQIYLIFLSLWKLILSNSFSTTSAVFLHDHRRFCWGKNNLCYLSEGFFEWCHINLSPQSRSDRLQGFSVCNS